MFSSLNIETAAIQHLNFESQQIPLLEKELWTSKQRQASSLHEISYRACFKPQLPRFFIEQLTQEGDVVYDPFSGRGTTAIEAALLGRCVIVNDINPLSEILTKPRLTPPESIAALQQRLSEINIDRALRADLDLGMFYHPDTECEIMSLKKYLCDCANKMDPLNQWIRMVATNRLTGHSAGFFSVYTFPPNQAISAERQIKINEQRNQQPIYRNTRAIILAKTRTLLKDLNEFERFNLANAATNALFITGDARNTPAIASDSVQLTVTSPPFLDIVQYASDNWLRCWFNSIDALAISQGITMARTLQTWREVMGAVFKELFRITKSGGYVAFEVGEVKKGTIKLEETVIPLGLAAGFHCEAIFINQQKFTKTSNIWGVENNAAGTNSNRIVVFKK